jgi:hypothetical protein
MGQCIGVSDNWINLNDSNSRSGLLSNNLIFAFDAARYLSYPGSGSTLDDLVSTVTGTITGPTFSTNNFGYFSFDGSNDEIRLNKGANVYNPIAIPTYNWSSYFWLKFNSVTDNYFFGDWSGGPATMAFGIVGGKLKLMWYTSGWYTATSNGTSVNTGEWVHIAYTISNAIRGTLNIYVNGVLNYSYVPAVNWNIGNMTTFGRYWSGSNFFNGSMSMCQIYNIEHTISQVQQQFNVHRKRYNV